MSSPEKTLKYVAQVDERGCIVLQVPFPTGTYLKINIKPAGEQVHLLTAAQSSLDFWNHIWDDEDWNDA